MQRIRKSYREYTNDFLTVTERLVRVLGDTLMSRSFLSQKAEVALKVVLYNRFMSL